jgi:hypothetical protein
MKYFIKFYDQEEKKVTKEEFVLNERRSGFRPKYPENGEPCTAGFTNSSNGCKGRIEYEDSDFD